MIQSNRLKIVSVQLIILCLFGPIAFVSADSPQVTGPPSNVQGYQNIASRAFKAIPEAINSAWQAASITCESIARGLKDFWNNYIMAALENFGNAIISTFLYEKNIREPIIEQKFQQEKKEMRQSIITDLPKASQDLWQRLKELFK